MTREDLRKELKELKEPYWRLAYVMGIHEKTLHYWFHCDAVRPDREDRIRNGLMKLKEKPRKTGELNK